MTKIKKKSKSKPNPNPAKKEERKVEKPLPKKALSEIDEIFSGKKRKKADEVAQNPSGEDKLAEKIKKKKQRNKNDQGREGFDGFAESVSKSRKKTEDGLSVFTEEELGLNKSDAGGTALCPFDCSCCF